ncbi:PAS domain S-box protein [Candidatus Poribacteria bacterium]|nr:PAS domain S-box protein [Candidatus Poribacteria bacterium]
MEEYAEKKEKYMVVLRGFLVLLAIYLTGFYNYLLFHSLAELFSIVVAFSIFTLAYNSRRFIDNNYLLFMGLASFFIAILDMLHTLSYKGMGVFPGFTANLPTQLWIMARYMGGISFLIAPLMLKRKLNIGLILIIYSAALSLLLLSLFYWRIFPDCYIEGSGLTPFKIVSEYIISLLLLISVILLYLKRREFETGIFYLLSASIIVTIASELAFTLYISVYGFSNMLGHLFKIVAFYLLYRALVQTGLVKPYLLLFRNLKNSQEILKLERDKAQKYLEVAGVIIISIAPDKKVTTINRKGCEILGYPKEDIIGKNWFQNFLPENVRDEVENVFEQLIKGKTDIYEHYDSRIVNKDGEERIISWNNTVLTNEDGKILGTLSSGEDVTENIIMEENLQWELMVNTAIADLANELINPSSTIENITNKVLEHARKVTESEHGYVSSIDPTTGNNVRIAITDFSGNSFLIPDKNNNIVFSADKNGKYPGLRGYSLNSRKPFYTNSPQNHKVYKGVPEGHILIKNFLSTPAVVGDQLMGQITLANSKRDYTEQDIKAVKRMADIYALAVQNMRAEQALRKALQISQQREAESSALLEGSRAVLEYRDFKSAASSLFEYCKNIVGATAGCIALLYNKGQEYDILYTDNGNLSCNENSDDQIPIMELRHKVYKTRKAIYSNRISVSGDRSITIENVLFAPMIIGKEMVGLLGLADKPGGFNEKDTWLASLFAEFAAIALHNSRTLESLERSEQRFRSVIQTASDAIIAFDSDFKVVFWSESAENLFGYPSEESEGLSVLEIIPEKFLNICKNELPQVKKTGETNNTFEVTAMRKDGIEVPVEISLTSWSARNELFYTAIARDITDRKEAQAKKAVEHEAERQRVLSMRSDRLRSLGEMAAGIAHELNQPLVGVRGMAEHLVISIERDWELTDEKIRDRASTIVEQADRMVHIIDHIRVFAREAGKPEVKAIKVNQIVRASMGLLKTQFRSRGIQLESNLSEGLPEVMANPYSLEEVVINLLINARDAVEELMNEGSVTTTPKVTLNTTEKYTGSKTFVSIEVTDTGTGIPKNIIEKVFDPFFTTKGPDRGTGLGLSISKTIVEEFAGKLEIKSEPGNGTTVTIMLSVL